jgi:citronellol/citronellal dehydrogenase
MVPTGPARGGCEERNCVTVKAFSESQGGAGTLRGRTLFITGASRGIGLAIALRAARDGANIVIAAKSVAPHPKLPGTIFTAAAQVEQAGGQALALAVDVRDEAQVSAAVERAAERFGGLDVLVNNASAISLTDTAQTSMKRFDLMHQVNARGTFLCSKLCVPHLARSSNPHILTISPPLGLAERWFAPHVAYSLSKYGMSLCVLGLAGELRPQGIAVNALWPRTVIATAALQVAMAGLEEEQRRRARSPQIMADAAHVILTRRSREFSGHFCIDEEVLRSVGEKNFSRYRPEGVSEEQLLPDLFL